MTTIGVMLLLTAATPDKRLPLLTLPGQVNTTCLSVVPVYASSPGSMLLMLMLQQLAELNVISLLLCKQMALVGQDAFQVDPLILQSLRASVQTCYFFV